MCPSPGRSLCHFKIRPGASTSYCIDPAPHAFRCPRESSLAWETPALSRSHHSSLSALASGADRPYLSFGAMVSNMSLTQVFFTG